MNAPPLGSPDWLNAVRASLPVRDPFGRSRPTQRFRTFCDTLNRPVSLEGANEVTVYLLLKILHAAGQISWFKEQPFSLNEHEHGLKATPDFLAVWCDGTAYVVEAKAAKYITVQVDQKIDQVRRCIDRSGMRYMLLTDRDHLCNPLRSNVRKVWNARHMQFTKEELARARASIDSGPHTLTELVAAGIDTYVVMHLVARGNAHFDLEEAQSELTVITRHPVGDASGQLYRRLFGDRSNAESWWHSLSYR